MNVNGRLKNLINVLGLNLKEFSRKADIPYPSLQNYIYGTRQPTIENLQKICIHLNVNLNWLLTGEGEMFTEKGKRVINIKDIPKEQMKGWLDEFWERANEEERVWLKVQFGKAFPEFNDWLLKKEGRES